MQRYQLYHRAVAMSKKYPDQKYDDILKSLMDNKTASDVTKSQTTVKNTNQSAKQPQQSQSQSQSAKQSQSQSQSAKKSQSQLAIQPQQGPKKLITVIIKFQLIN